MVKIRQKAVAATASQIASQSSAIAGANDDVMSVAASDMTTAVRQITI